MALQKKSQAGFSLFELMIAIALIAILSVIAAPNVINFLPGYRLKSAASDLQSNMQKARMLAVNTNSPVQMRFNLGVVPGFYYFDDDQDGVWDAGEFRVDLSTYGSGVDFGRGTATANWDGTAFAANTTLITFGTRGTAIARTVYLQNQDLTTCYAITTSIAGTAKARHYNGMTPFNVNNWIQ
ncbi:MAG: GspH/FimT family pseudopilin [Pseudomonadota bacterium]